TSGTPPAGLTLGPTTGVISGTPTTAATANFTVTVTDSASRTASQSLSMTINPATLAISTNSLPVGMVGTAYSQTLTATGGTAPYTWAITSGTLPAGLAWAPTTGLISGTATTAGTFNFTVQVTDNGPPKQTVAKLISITINPSQLTITSASPLVAGMT